MSCEDEGRFRAFEISKYSPKARRTGDDWISCCAIRDGRITREQYLAVEDRYVRVILRVCERFGPVTSHGLERWELADDVLASMGLAEVFSDIEPPVAGAELDPRTIENVARRCLREVAWLELVARPELIVHFGWDMKLIVGVSRGIDDLLDEAREDGLYVYKTNRPFDTQQRWAADG